MNSETRERRGSGGVSEGEERKRGTTPARCASQPPQKEKKRLSEVYSVPETEDMILLGTYISQYKPNSTENIIITQGTQATLR